MKKNTLNNSILTSLKDLSKPSSAKEIYQHILLSNYYITPTAQTPWATVNAVLGNFVNKIEHKNKNVERKKINGIYHYFIKELTTLKNTPRKIKSIWKSENLQLLENSIEIIDNTYSVKEGKSKYRKHLVRERNNKIIKFAKIKFKKEKGKLYCEICKFDFEKVYGKIGIDFIEGHHDIPISELKENQETKIEDISLVCSNCHKMLHRRKPWLTISELKKLIN